MKNPKPKPFSAFVLLSSLMLITNILLLLVSHSSIAAVEAGGGDNGGQRRSEAVQWEILTKRNFSSQIRLHSHLLLMVTVPWSGESRSLMKEVAQLLAGKQEELGHLKLVVVFRNSEKMLADALGASEGITLFYYHRSTSYKYQGRLRAQNILSAVYRFMLLQSEEVPLKPIHTQQDLENFIQSTDKSVLLLEFCGWTDELLHRKNHDDNETTRSVKSHSETVGLFKENLSREASGRMAFEKIKNQKAQGLNSEELACGIETGLADSPLLGGLIWSNQSDSQGSEYRSDDIDMSCTAENFHKFHSFFLEFMKIAREYFLPLERHRFGLISEKSLVPFLDVGKPESWSVLLQFSGCSNCSVIVREGDDLQNILQTHHSLVKELDTDGSLESVFPANRPSVILFIDRSSDSSKFRRDSESALQVFRKFVKDNRLSYHFIRGQDISNPEGSSGIYFTNTRSQIDPDHSFQKSVKHVAPKIVKVKDNMAIMIMDRGESISLDATTDAQGNSLHNILANLLQQNKPAGETRETKISLVAKEVGFQLLSDDFEVPTVDSSPFQNEGSQLNYINDNTITSMEDQTPKPVRGFNDEYAVSNEIVVDSNDIASVNDEMQPEHANTETCLNQDQETVPCSESDINKLTSTLAKDLENDICASRSTQVDEEEDLQPFTCPAKDSSNLDKESPVVDELIDEQNIDQSYLNLNKTCPDVSVTKQNLTDATSLKDGHDAGEVIESVGSSMSDEWHVQRLPFEGSFFFSDSGYQLLISLTGGEKIPSLVILDPVSQHHYVYSEETDISYSSLANFVEKFMNGSLTPYQHTASPVTSSREFPIPPFVNLDFREADSIPRVTANTFCELIIGFKPCGMRNDLSLSQIQDLGSVWKMDTLVLFSTSWCTFCQRMELIVREVYRTFKTFAAMMKSESKKWDSMHIQDNADDTMQNGLPSVFLMDCTLNDCGAFLKPIGKKELYPALMLFPAENKTALTYEGDMSVVSIIEFLISCVRNSHYLTRHKGFLLAHSWKGGKSSPTLFDDSSPAHEGTNFAENKYNEILFNTELIGEAKRDNHLHIAAGSILASSDKLLNASPFDNSTILIVKSDKNQGFQGIIINKRISWDIFKEFDPQLESLNKAPLFYGGPVRAPDLPLVSLSRKAVEGYVKVTASVYFGDPLSTRLAIEGIKSGDQSAADFWFFLGYSSWAWTQLFDELAEGAWYLSESPIKIFDEFSL